MIVLDTDVVSELMRQAQAPGVARWADTFAAEDVFVTAVTAAELLYGVVRLPEGRRKQELYIKVDGRSQRIFETRSCPLTGPQRRTTPKSVWRGNVLGVQSAWPMRRPPRSAALGRRTWRHATSTTSPTRASMWSIRGIPESNSWPSFAKLAGPQRDRSLISLDENDGCYR